MAKKEERFKEYPFDENILVGEYGTIKSYYKYRTPKKSNQILDEPRILKPYVGKYPNCEYFRVCSVGLEDCYVHRIVAHTWIPKGYSKINCNINHIDENRKNNYYKNLEWCTLEYNTRYSNGVKVKIGDVLYPSIRSASIALKITPLKVKELNELSKGLEKYNAIQ